MRYFFHVLGGRFPIEDDEGTTFQKTADAVAHAEIMADDLAQDDDQYSGYEIVIVDEQDRVVARIPID
jgi:hypothetical protein